MTQPAPNSTPTSARTSPPSTPARMGFRRTRRALLGAATVALSLSAQPALARECKPQLFQLWGASNLLVNEIPVIGSFASFGSELTRLAVCDGAPQDEVDLDKVIDLVAAGVEENELAAAEREINTLRQEIAGLGTALNGPVFDTDDFAAVPEGARDEVLDKAVVLRQAIMTVENRLFAVLTEPRDSRTSYNLDAVLMLGNLKLGLGKLRTALAPDSLLGPIDLDIDAAQILSDLAVYEQESDRLRHLTVGISTDDDRGTITATAEVRRNNVLLGTFESRCFKSLAPELGPPAPCSREIAKIGAARKAGSLIGRLNRALDIQSEVRVALLVAKAEAIGAGAGSFANLSLDAPEPRFVIGNGAADRCLARSGSTTRMQPCIPGLPSQSWVFEPSGVIRSALTHLCLEASGSEQKLLVLACNPGNVRQRFGRAGNKLQITLGGNGYCVSPEDDDPLDEGETVRWGSCQQIRAEEWFAYTTLENKALQDDAAPLGPEHPAFGLKPEPTLCLSELGDVLASCDRYDTHQLWAHDAVGRFRPLSAFGQALASRGLGVSLVVKPIASTGDDARFAKRNAGDGTFTITAFHNASRFVFPGAPEANAQIFLDGLPTDASGAPVNFALWR